MIGRLNHVGVAVPSIEAAKKTYRDLYGVPESAITETRELPAQGVKFAFVNIANSQIDRPRFSCSVGRRLRRHGRCTDA